MPGQSTQYVLHAKLPGSEVWVGEVPGPVTWAASTAGIQVVRGLEIAEAVLSLEGGREAVSLELVGDVLGILDVGPFGAAAVCEVALLDAGQDWGMRETVISNAKITNLSQSLGGRWSLTIEKDLERDSALALTEFTIAESYRGSLPPGFFTYNTGAHDQPWPVAVGRCYGVPLIRWRKSSSRDYAIVAGHPLPAVELTVYDRGNAIPASSRYTQTPVNTTIKPSISYDYPNPLTISYIEGLDGISYSGGPSWENEDGSLSNYCEGITTRLIGGGVRNGRNEVVLGAGMVLEYMLQQSGVAVDWPRMAPAIAALQGWDVGCYIDGRASWLSIVRDRLLPVLPLIEHESDAGIWYSYHVPWQTQPRGTLTAGVDFSPDSDIEWDMEVINTVVLQYAYDYGVEEYTKQVTVGPDQSPICKASSGALAFGVRQAAQPITSTVLHTDSAALLAGRVLAERKAIPRRRFSVMMRSAQWDSLMPGQTVWVSWGLLDADREVLCQVLEVPRRRWPGRVLLETVPRSEQGTPKPA